MGRRLGGLDVHVDDAVARRSRVPMWRRTRTVSTGTVAGMVAAMLLSAGAAAQYGGSGWLSEPPRRDVALPGLESHTLLVDPSVEWYDRAAAGMAKAYRSAVAVQNAAHLDWPPLSGYVIGPRQVITAHLRTPAEGEPAPRFTIRTVENTFHTGVQVAAWETWDFGIIEFDEDLPVPPVEFGDDLAARAGDIVLTIGSPSSFGRTGLLITSVGTFVQQRDGFIVTDVSMNAGGSGSPIHDVDGRLLGMSSFGWRMPILGIDDITVSELTLRNGVPVDRAVAGGESGAGATAIARLVAPYLP